MSTLRALSMRAYAASILSCLTMLSACGGNTAAADNAVTEQAAVVENTSNSTAATANEAIANETDTATQPAEAPNAAEPLAAKSAPAAAAAAPAAPAVAAAAAAPGGDAASGAKLFVQCRVCHSVEPDKNGLGPSLHGVVGRKAGTLAGFNFSPAMKNSGNTWTPAVLNDYLRAPMKALPGTKMAFAGIADDARRADVIAYLETLK